MAKIREINGTWQLDWYHNGRRHRKSLGKITSSEAKQCLRSKELELSSTKQRLSPTFTSFSNKYCIWHQNEFPSSTVRAQQIIKQWLQPIFGDMYMHTITIPMVEEYKHYRNAAPATIAKELRVLKAVFNKALEWEIINKNPITKVKSPQLLNDRPFPYYEKAQLSRIYQDDPRSRWRFIANTGLRRSEALNLSRADIRDKGLYIVSNFDVRTKSGKARFIPFNAASRSSLVILLKDNDTDYVMPQVHPKSMSRAFKSTLRRTGLPGSIHWLRHSFASHLVREGKPITFVQHLMGHSDVKTTMKYVWLNDEYKLSQFKGFEV